MTADALTQNEKARFLDLLFDNSITFEGVEKKFKELFPTVRFSVVAREVKLIARDLIFSCDGPALITALYTIDLMRRAECASATALLFDVLAELERAIRKDMFLHEQIKYASKEVRDARKSVDAVRADELRVHCAAKVFVLDLLGGKEMGDTKPSARIAMKQDAIDSALDAWEKASAAVKEPLANATQCWTSERVKQRCGAPLEYGAVFDSTQPQRRSAVIMTTAPAKIPSLPVTSGETQFLLPGQKALLLFDSEVPSSEWSTAKRLLHSAASSSLSPDDQQTLVESLSSKVMKHVDFRDETVCDIAQHNPEVCAVIVSKLSPATARSRLQALIISKVSKAKVAVVLLNAPKSVEQISLRSFVVACLEELKDKTSDKEAVKSFMDCVHELVVNSSKENKELYIADALKPDLEKLVKSVDIPEVTTKWEEMKG